ncbi:MAG: peptidylprolyl isomerase [Deltaproteobacteria bacterium]|nr:peptidylprolyl isomerase [Deltaproteobacteria bacterium]
MGARPLAGFQDVGIKVYFKEGATTVSEAVQLLSQGVCREFGPSQTCGGGDSCGHDHHHEVVERPPVEGPLEAGSGRAVGFTYTLFDAETGEQIDSSEGQGPVSYLHGSGQILPGLEQAMGGLGVGASATVTLPPEEAYGPRNPQLVHSVPRSQFETPVEPGSRVQTRTPQGIAVLHVLEVTDEEVTLDANHPLAGRAVRFSVEVVDVQQAAPEELAAGRLLV